MTCYDEEVDGQTFHYELLPEGYWCIRRGVDGSWTRSGRRFQSLSQARNWVHVHYNHLRRRKR